MKRLWLIAALAGIAMALSSTADAQNNRSFVSGHGSDSNPCSLADPCRSFAGALAQTNANGEITVLDSAGYGAVTINKSVSIVNPGGVEAGITAPSGQPAITVNLASNVEGVVQLRGLTLEGGGVASDGIQLLEALRLEIVDCVIRNFHNDGINLRTATGFTGETVSISNTIVSDNNANGIEIAPQSGFQVRGVMDHATTNHNGQNGMLIDGTGATNNGFVDIAITNSVSDGNGLISGGGGFTAQALGNEKVEIKNSTSSNNITNGLAVSNARVGLSTTSLVLNGAGFSITNSGTIFSFGNNIIENNRDLNTGTLTPASR